MPARLLAQVSQGGKRNLTRLTEFDTMISSDNNGAYTTTRGLSPLLRRGSGMIARASLNSN